MSDEDKKLDKKAEELAKTIAKTVKEEVEKSKDSSFDELQKQVSTIADSLNKQQEDLLKKVYVGMDTKKEVSKLDEKEMTKAYARALFAGDKDTVQTLSEEAFNRLNSEEKALSEGVNADGGFLVPQDFLRRLVMEREEILSMRQRVTVIPMKTNVLTIPKHETGPEVSWGGEGETKPTTTMDFSQPTITAYKLVAIIYMTDELMEDAAFSLTDIIIKKFAEKMAEAEEKAILVGTGVGQPTGIFINAVVVAAAIACVGNLDFDDLIGLIYALPVKYRTNAAFIVHNTNVRELRILKDNDGRYLWQEPVAAGQPATIHGYPVIVTYDCGEDEIAFGDYREAYWLGERHGMRVKITQDETTAFTQDKTAIRVVKRIGGDVIQTNAVRILNQIP